MASLSSSPITTLTGRFTERHATRLLWRAGFGPARGQARELAGLGLDGAVASLTQPSGPAKLIGRPPRCVALTPESQFDTHSAQAATFDSDLPVIADAIAAFQADLEARGIADRVLIHVWSEFGRRALENGSHGTDHGAAGVSMLIGTRAAGQMVGQWPQLTRLDVNGNQRANVDFRGVYCSLLEQWFGQDAAAVIPDASRFARYQLIR